MMILNERTSYFTVRSDRSGLIVPQPKTSGNILITSDRSSF
jgi:hypothetical protein